MSKKIIALLLALVFLGIPLFSMMLLPVHASTNWNAPVNITNNAAPDFQSVITYDPTRDGKSHVAWVRRTGAEETPTSWEIFYAHSDDWATHNQITNDNIKDYNPMIDMDDSGVVHIVWVKEVSMDRSDIMYTNSNDFTNHVNVSRQEKGEKNWYPTLVVEKDTGIPHIAWQVGGQEPPGEIFYRHGATGTLEAVTNTPSWSMMPSIDLDQNKNVHCVWTELFQSDMDVRLTNSTVWPATPTDNYLNVSDIVNNQDDDLRPDIVMNNVNEAHITWYRDLTTPAIFWAVSNSLNTFVWNFGPVSPREMSCKNPSIRVSSENNSVIIYQGQLQDWDIYAIDYNGSGGVRWVPLDISNNTYPDSLEWSSIGALDEDEADILYATYYTEIGVAAAPNLEVFVVDGYVKGEGIPGFELMYLMMIFLGFSAIWYFYKHRSRTLA